MSFLHIRGPGNWSNAQGHIPKDRIVARYPKANRVQEWIEMKWMICLGWSKLLKIFVSETRENLGHEWKRHGFKFDHVYIQIGGHLVLSVNKHNCLHELWYFYNLCGSFNMENRCVCRCSSRGGDGRIFFTQLMCLIKVVLTTLVWAKLIILLQTANLTESVKK